MNLLSLNPAFAEFGKFRDSLCSGLCPEDRKGFGDLLSIAILGIKSEVRPIFWEKISSKDGRVHVTEQLNFYTPRIVEHLYRMINAKNIYEVKCVFRNHQRIVTHYMKLLEEVGILFYQAKARQP